ncbi:MAG: LPP20 family lipoprotein [Prevotellaceae bacterium]|jgi:hypothetical protein|nr:LPP20 family lipoprotein [Prevotellaceae bacterium]
MRNCKKLAVVAVAAMFAGAAVTGCGGAKSVQSASTEVSVPFSDKEYKTDKEFFRASQSGKSPDLATAKKIALQNAKTELAGNIQSTIKAVTENYTNQRSVGDKQEFENKFEENARAVVNQTLNDVRIIGEKVFKEKDGKHTYYIAIEMSKEPVVNNIADRISKDAKLQLDFDKHQFQKVFDEEMQKFEAQQ